MNAACSYWISCRRRVREQIVVWDPERVDDQGQRLGAILPQVITAGTVTRRAVEATWMTARFEPGAALFTCRPLQSS